MQKILKFEGVIVKIFGLVIDFSNTISSWGNSAKKLRKEKNIPMNILLSWIAIFILTLEFLKCELAIFRYNFNEIYETQKGTNKKKTSI